MLAPIDPSAALPAGIQAEHAAQGGRLDWNNAYAGGLLSEIAVRAVHPDALARRVAGNRVRALVAAGMVIITGKKAA